MIPASPAEAIRPTIATPIAFRDDLPEAVDVVIIGGGVIGVFTALSLARMGRSVLICEKGRIAGEQSSRNWGWIRQQGRDEAELPIMTQSLGLWRSIDEELKGACGFAPCGVTYLGKSDADQASNEAWVKLAASYGVASRLLSKREIDAMFSGASDGAWVGGVTTPSDARGEPWAAVPAVARLAHAEGVAIREACAVRALDIAAGRVSGVVTEHGTVRCDQVILAGGAWSALFARNHGVDLPQLSVRATVAATAPLPQFFDGAAVDENLALRRRADGGYSIAWSGQHGFYLGPDAFRHFSVYWPQLRLSWREIDLSPAAPPGFPDAWRTPRRWSADEASPFEANRVLEPKPDANYLRKMTAMFETRFPGVGRPAISSAWAGMIDATPDVVPIIDRAPGLDGLIIATGMCGHGFGIGPGFGRCLARMATGATAEHDLRRFRFSRFAEPGPLTLGPSL